MCLVFWTNIDGNTIFELKKGAAANATFCISIENCSVHSVQTMAKLCKPLEYHSIVFNWFFVFLNWKRIRHKLDEIKLFLCVCHSKQVKLQWIQNEITS